MEFVRKQRWFQRTTDFAQYLVLLRQFNVVAKIVTGLPATQRHQIASTALAQLAESSAVATDPNLDDARQWSAEASRSYPRVRSPHGFIHVPAMQRWLVCAYRATFNSPYGEVQNLHRAVLRALRTMQIEPLARSSEVRRDQRRYA
jgi:hypothetical protein